MTVSVPVHQAVKERNVDTMTIRFTGSIDEDKTVICLAENQGQLTLLSPIAAVKEATERTSVYLYLKERQPKIAALEPLNQQTIKEKEVDRALILTPPWEIEGETLLAAMTLAWAETGLKVETITQIPGKVPANQQNMVGAYQESVFELLESFGYPMVKVKKKPAKAQHRWNKAVSEITFYIDYSDAKGEAVWQKRDQLLLKKGATLKMTVPLNKDGSVGYSARLTEKLRDDNRDKIKGDTTTEDIIFKSVNELGIFLYYAGTNGWLVLKDQEGKTIDEYTVVK